MKVMTELLNQKKNYYMLHAASGMVWGTAIVMAHISIIARFWTSNTYVTIAWALMVQGALSLYYHCKGPFSVVKGVGITAAVAAFTIAAAFILSLYGL
ncbi:hypothetical protein [Anoxynatronum sibiricum]|uniref:Uncharacterized protein n=1 Tax=Anoxynatronum sibiricum TaxID=210623 RepID=A0ABU9VX01_9CLOT